MKTALHRSGLGGSDFNQSDKEIALHPDLVAYYAFENDTGYVIKDVSSHGHDLQAIAEPNWQVENLTILSIHGCSWGTFSSHLELQVQCIQSLCQQAL